MKDMLNIDTDKTLKEVAEIVPLTSFVGHRPGGYLFWFETPEIRTSAMGYLTAAGCTCEVIEHDDQETVESEKAVIDTPPPAEPENEKEYLNET